MSLSAIVAAADPAAALNRILRGNFQQAVDAWAALEPKLRTFADGLAAAIRRYDVEVMRFEYKRVEAFNRGIGALLNRIAAALEDLEEIAGEPEYASVQRIHTRGGTAPARRCDEATLGRTERVPYSADYVFVEGGRS